MMFYFVCKSKNIYKNKTLNICIKFNITNDYSFERIIENKKQIRKYIVEYELLNIYNLFDIRFIDGDNFLDDISSYDIFIVNSGYFNKTFSNLLSEDK